MKKFVVVFLLTSLTLSHACKTVEKDKQKTKEEFVNSLPPDLAPPIVKRPKITYPFSLKNSRKKAKIVVYVSVDFDGKVFEAKTRLSSDTTFNAHAESLAYHFVFAPPVYDGKPRRIKVGIPMIFDPDSIEVEKR